MADVKREIPPKKVLTKAERRAKQVWIHFYSNSAKLFYAKYTFITKVQIRISNRGSFLVKTDVLLLFIVYLFCK